MHHEFIITNTYCVWRTWNILKHTFWSLRVIEEKILRTSWGDYYLILLFLASWTTQILQFRTPKVTYGDTIQYDRTDMALWYNSAVNDRRVWTSYYPIMNIEESAIISSIHHDLVISLIYRVEYSKIVFWCKRTSLNCRSRSINCCDHQEWVTYV